MKILFVCHRFPFPPNEGGKIRAFNMIAHLHQHHEVTVASLTETKQERDEMQGIEPHCSDYISQHISKPLAWIRAAFCLLTTIPSSMGYFHSSRLKNRIQHLIKKK